MTTDTDQALRDALADLAAQSPDLAAGRVGGAQPWAAEVWESAIRQRRRERVVVILAAVVVTLCAGTLLTALVGVGLGPVRPTDGAPGDAVPSKVWAVPDRLTTNVQDAPGDRWAWSPDVAEGDLAIGRAALVFAAAGWADRARLPVVITARDGRYHLLDLPGYSAASLINTQLDGEGAPFALSPDGLRLAYAWWDPAAPLDRPMPSGVRVVDLVTGAVRTFTVPGGNGVMVSHVAFSSAGRWLAWSGLETKSWTPASLGGTRAVAGRIDPAGRVDRLPGRLEVDGGVAIADDGLLAVVQSQDVRTWDGRRVARWRDVADGNSVPPRIALTPSGRRLAIAAPQRADGGLSGGITVLERDGSPVDVLLPQDRAGDGEPGSFDPVGWIGDDTVVAVAAPDGAEGEAHLALAPLAPEDGGRDAPRIVAELPAGVGEVSVATDLMSLAAPTADRPEPQWPWSTERLLVVAALVLIAAAAALTLARIAIRRRWPRGLGGTRWRVPRISRRTTTLAMIGVAVIVGALQIVTLANGASGPTYRLDPGDGTLRMGEGIPRITGLPDDVRAGVDYPVRILIPAASTGSRLRFTALDRARRTLSPLDIRLCPPDHSGPPTAKRCTVRTEDADFAVWASAVRELPAVIRVPEAWAGRSIRFQYQVLGPRSAWNPLAPRSERLYTVETAVVR